MKFIHAADLHIDSPMRGLDDYEGAPTDRLRGATRQAFMALIDLAIQQRVHMVVLAGDIYDGDWADFRTGLFFREQMLRLVRANIRAFVVRGNHDAESQITRQLPDVDGVHVFSARRAETIDLPDVGVAIHGRSFPQREVLEDLTPAYPPPVPGRFNIGVLHTSLTGREGHDTYAPTTVDALCGKGYDYFALGHVHAREVVREAHPRIVFPGNLQGRHARETGPKGCELVTVEGGVITAHEFIELDTVRWHTVQLDATSLQSLDALARQFLVQAYNVASTARDRLHALRVNLSGQSPLHRIEAEQPGTLAASLRAASQELDDVDVWVEQVKIDLRSPVDRPSLAERDDPLGEVVRLTDLLSADPAGLRDWIQQQTLALKLPATLASAHPQNFSNAELQALLADAEATVLAHLSRLGTDTDT